MRAPSFLLLFQVLAIWSADAAPQCVVKGRNLAALQPVSTETPLHDVGSQATPRVVASLSFCRESCPVEGPSPCKKSGFLHIFDRGSEQCLSTFTTAPAIAELDDDTLVLKYNGDGTSATVTLECDTDSLGKPQWKWQHERFELRYSNHTSSVRRDGTRYSMTLLSPCACSGARECGVGAVPQAVPCQFGRGIDLTGAAAAEFVLDAVEQHVEVSEGSLYSRDGSIAGAAVNTTTASVRSAAVALDEELTMYRYVVGFCTPVKGALEGYSPCSKAPGNGFVQQFTSEEISGERGSTGEGQCGAGSGVCYKDFNSFTAKGLLRRGGGGLLPFNPPTPPPSGFGADGGVWISSRDASYPDRNRSAVVRVWCDREGGSRSAGGHGVQMSNLRRYARQEKGKNVVLVLSAPEKQSAGVVVQKDTKIYVFDFASQCACPDAPSYCSSTAANTQPPLPAAFPCYAGGGIGPSGKVEDGTQVRHKEVIHLDGAQLNDDIHRLDAVAVHVRGGSVVVDTDATEMLLSMCRPITPSARGMPNDPCESSPGPGYVQLFTSSTSPGTPAGAAGEAMDQTCLADFNAHGRLEVIPPSGTGVTAKGGVSLISEDWAYAAMGLGVRVMNVTILCDPNERNDLAYSSEATSQLVSMLLGKENGLQWGKGKSPPRMVVHRDMSSGGAVDYHVNLRSRCACPGVCAASSAFKEQFGEAVAPSSAPVSGGGVWGFVPSIGPKLYTAGGLFSPPTAAPSSSADVGSNSIVGEGASGSEWVPPDMAGRACRVAVNPDGDGDSTVDFSAMKPYQFTLPSEDAPSTPMVWMVGFCTPTDVAVFGPNPCSMAYAAHFHKHGTTCHHAFNNALTFEPMRSGGVVGVKVSAEVRSGGEEIISAARRVRFEVACSTEMPPSPYSMRVKKGETVVRVEWNPPLPTGPGRDAAKLVSNMTYVVLLESRCACPGTRCTSGWGSSPTSGFAPVGVGGGSGGGAGTEGEKLDESARTCSVDGRDLSTLPSLQFAAKEVGSAAAADADDQYQWYIDWCTRRPDSSCARDPGPGYVVQTALPPSTTCWKDFNTHLKLQSASTFDGVVLTADQGAKIGGESEQKKRSVRVEVECDSSADDVTTPSAVAKVQGEGDSAVYTMRVRSKCACKGGCPAAGVQPPSPASPPGEVGADSGAGGFGLSPWPAILDKLMPPSMKTILQPKTASCSVDLGARKLDLRELGTQEISHTIGECDPAFGSPKDAQWVFDFCKEITSAPSGYDACTTTPPPAKTQSGKVPGIGFAHVLDNEGNCLMRLDDTPRVWAEDDSEASERGNKKVIVEFATSEALTTQKGLSRLREAVVSMFGTDRAKSGPTNTPSSTADGRRAHRGVVRVRVDGYNVSAPTVESDGSGGFEPIRAATPIPDGAPLTVTSSSLDGGSVRASGSPIHLPSLQHIGDRAGASHLTTTRRSASVMDAGASLHFTLRVELHCDRHLTEESGLSLHPKEGDAVGKGVEESRTSTNRTWTLHLATCLVCAAGCAPKPPPADPCGAFKQLPLREIPTTTIPMREDHMAGAGRRENGTGKVYRWVISPCERITKPPVGHVQCPIAAAGGGFAQMYDSEGEYCYKDFGSRVQMSALSAEESPSKAFAAGTATAQKVAQHKYGGVALSADDHRVAGKGRRQAVMRIWCDPRNVSIKLRPIYIPPPTSLHESAVASVQHSGSVCGAQTWTLDFSSPCACEGSVFYDYCTNAETSSSFGGGGWASPGALVPVRQPVVGETPTQSSAQLPASVKAFCAAYGRVPSLKLRVRPTEIITPPLPLDVHVALSLCTHENVFDTPCSKALSLTGGAFGQLYVPDQPPYTQCVDTFDGVYQVEMKDTLTDVSFVSSQTGSLFNLTIVCDKKLAPNSIAVESAHTTEYSPEPLIVTRSKISQLHHYELTMRSRCACKGECVGKLDDPRPQPRTIADCPAALKGVPPLEFESGVEEKDALNETYTWVVGYCAPVTSPPEGLDLCTKSPGPGYVQSYRREKGWCIRDFNSGGKITRTKIDGTEAVVIDAFDGNTGEAKHRTVTVTLLCAAVDEPIVMKAEGSSTKYVSAAYDHSGGVHHYHITIKHPGACSGATKIAPSSAISLPPVSANKPCGGLKSSDVGLDGLSPALFHLPVEGLDNKLRRMDFDVSVCRPFAYGACARGYPWSAGYVQQSDLVPIKACTRNFRDHTTRKRLPASSLGGEGFSFGYQTKEFGAEANGDIATVNVRCSASGDAGPVMRGEKEPRIWWNPSVPAVITKVAGGGSRLGADVDELPKEFVFEFLSPCACGPCERRAGRGIGFIAWLLIFTVVGVVVYFAAMSAKNLYEGNFPIVPHQAALMSAAAVAVSIGGFVIGLTIDVGRTLWAKLPFRRGPVAESSYSLAAQDDESSDDGNGIDGLSLVDDEGAL